MPASVKRRLVEPAIQRVETLRQETLRQPLRQRHQIEADGDDDPERMEGVYTLDVEVLRDQVPVLGDTVRVVLVSERVVVLADQMLQRLEPRELAGVDQERTAPLD